MLAAFTGWQALQARSDLAAAAVDLEQLSDELSSGDPRAAEATLATAQEHASDAVDHTQGPGWWLLARLPSVGPNVTAVQEVAGVADELASDILPGVLPAARTLDPEALRPVDGRVDLEPIEQSAPSVVRASRQLSDVADRASAIDSGPLLGSVAGPVEDLQDRVARADVLASRASRAVRLLPAMLGGDGPRRYLFLFQNNAEVRATGGIPGAFAVITADDGRLELGKQGDAVTLGRFDEPPVPLTGEERALFGEGLGTYPQDVNFTPDFPRTAELAAGMWKASGGAKVDGVVSADPIALSYLLRGTGPVRTAGGRELTADGVVPLLLSDVYAEITDPVQQNVFFNAAARSVFDAVAAGQGEPSVVLDGLVQGASERRVLVWSARKAEQKLLTPTALGGVLPTSAGEAPDVGVHLNAALPYKLDYYLDHQVSVVSRRCQAERQHLTVEVTMTSTVPADPSGLTTYVAPAVGPFDQGTILNSVYFFAPVDGWVERLEIDGEEREFRELTLDGRAAFATSVALPPGESRRLSVDMVSGPGQSAPTSLQVTPGVRSDGVGEIGASACS